MKTAQYPEIGTTVEYIRNIPDQGIVKGTAIMLAVCLDPDKHLLAHLKDGENIFNVYLKCVNPTPEFEEEFKNVIAAVLAVADEGRRKGEEIVKEHNEAVVALYNGLLGPPVEFQ